ncbi:MAG: ring-cleaving dioxygenase, partial [Chloroflexota bacterium]
MAELGGLHHVTAITGDAPGNVRFYTEVVGLRLVKKTVNQDDVAAYHLFYADARGNPGTDMTFFDWPHAVVNRPGVPEIAPIALRVPEGSLDYWRGRLDEQQVAHTTVADTTGKERVAFADPERQRLALAADPRPTRFQPWSDSPVPEEHQVRGLHAVTLASVQPQRTADFLSSVMGFAPAGDLESEGGRVHTFALGGRDSGAEVNLLLPKEPVPSRQGRGGVHHVAFRVPDANAQEEWRQRVNAAGLQTTPIIDRFYFKSIYFREPGGNLFEIATDGPGFTADEPESELGHHLALPPFL